MGSFFSSPGKAAAIWGWETTGEARRGFHSRGRIDGYGILTGLSSKAHARNNLGVNFPPIRTKIDEYERRESQSSPTTPSARCPLHPKTRPDSSEKGKNSQWKRGFEASLLINIAPEVSDLRQKTPKGLKWEFQTNSKMAFSDSSSQRK